MKKLNSIHCLLIDDDEEEIEIFKMALNHLNLPVRCSSYTNCNNAIQQITDKTLVPDCIFLDLHMGMIDGKEALLQIKNSESGSQIPVVILSGSNNESEIKNLKNMGAHEFIVKADTIKVLSNELLNYFIANFQFNSEHGI